tara:strand:+ start:62 stop:208 length:147 start_codon:yes stop_codon:yes gene_type:complete
MKRKLNPDAPSITILLAAMNSIHKMVHRAMKKQGKTMALKKAKRGVTS